MLSDTKSGGTPARGRTEITWSLIDRMFIQIPSAVVLIVRTRSLANGYLDIGYIDFAVHPSEDFGSRGGLKEEFQCPVFVKQHVA